MLPAVREAICDEDESVRKHASGVLSLLYNAVGQVAVSTVVPQLISRLTDPPCAEHRLRLPFRHPNEEMR